MRKPQEGFIQENQTDACYRHDRCRCAAYA